MRDSLQSPTRGGLKRPQSLRPRGIKDKFPDIKLHGLYKTYEDIVEACCDAWDSLMAMPERIASIAKRSWAKAS